MNFNPELFPGDSERAEKSFTARDFFHIIFKHKGVILFTFISVTLVVALSLIYLPPTYVVQAKVLVKTEQQGNPSFFSGIAAYREQRDSDPVNRKIETEMELLTTRSLAEAVVRKTNLRYDQVYHKPYVHLLNLLADTYYKAKQSLFGTGPTKDRYGFKATVDQFSDSFTVAPVKSKSAETNSNVIEVQLKAADPLLAQVAVQALLEQYLNYSIDLNQKSGAEAYKIVEQNTRDAMAKVEEAQNNMRQFLMKRGTDQALPYMASGDVPAANAAAGVPSQGSDTVSTPGDNTSVSVLKSRLIDMELRLVELKQSYSNGSSNVVVAEQAVAQLKKRIQDEVLRNADYQTTYAQLDREQKSAEQFYLELKRKLDQISLFLKMNPYEVDNRVITEPPLYPESSQWKKDLAIGALASLLGLILGLGIAGYREYSDHTLQTPEDVKRYLGLDTLATVHLAEAKEMAQAVGPNDMFRE
jgi:uncharacterized protein involved in exopolysaccharide biosynthesis